MRRALEQVFMRRRGGRLEALLVVELESGARERPTMPLPSTDEGEAAAMLGRLVARRGMAERARGVRLRVERGGTLHDDQALAGRLVEAFEAERRRDDAP